MTFRLFRIVFQGVCRRWRYSIFEFPTPNPISYYFCSLIINRVWSCTPNAPGLFPCSLITAWSAGVRPHRTPPLVRRSGFRDSLRLGSLFVEIHLAFFCFQLMQPFRSCNVFDCCCLSQLLWPIANLCALEVDGGRLRDYTPPSASKTTHPRACRYNSPMLDSNRRSNYRS